MALRKFLEEREPFLLRRKFINSPRENRSGQISKRISELEHELATTDCEPCKDIIGMKIKGYKRRLAELEDE